MLARTHVLSGACLWVAAAQFGGQGDPLELAAGAVVAGGAALLPDLDHHRGTAAQVWGPISRSLGSMVGRATGGHRAGTHTLLAAVLAGAAVHTVLLAGSWPAVLVVAVLVGLALVAWENLLPGRLERYWPANLAASLLAGWALVRFDVVLAFLPAAVLLGWLAHIAGDAVTTGGVRPLMPFTEQKVRLTRLRTGGRIQFGPLRLDWEKFAQWLFSVTAVMVALMGAV